MDIDRIDRIMMAMDHTMVIVVPVPDVPLNKRINSIKQNDPSVTGFYLGDREGQTVSENRIRALFRALQQNMHVRKLDLRCTPNRLRPTVCRELLPPLLQENLSIEDLHFPWNMTNAHFLPAADVLYNDYNATLKTLHLHHCDIRGREGGEIVALLIRRNRHITTIDLTGNQNLGPAGASQIAAALGDDDCALKTLDLSSCGIGDEGVDALCTALQVNNSLKMFWFCRNRITDEGYRAVARSLPRMSGLKVIRFGWEQRQVSAAVLQQMMEGLRMTHSLLRIFAWHQHLSEEQKRQWETCCAFVGARNKMNGHLDEVRDAARDGRVAPVPIPICSLLWWCRRQGNSEVQASLIHPLLRSRVMELVGLADIVVEEDGEKEKAITDATTMRTGDPQSETTTRADASWTEDKRGAATVRADATTTCVEDMRSKATRARSETTTHADATTTRAEDMQSETTRQGRTVRKWISLLCCRGEEELR